MQQACIWGFIDLGLCRDVARKRYVEGDWTSGLAENRGSRGAVARARRANFPERVNHSKSHRVSHVTQVMVGRNTRGQLLAQAAEPAGLADGAGISASTVRW
jgi:hypothetical protein